MTSPRTDSVRLSDILRSVDRIEQVLRSGYESFSNSWMSQSAVIRELEIIGEAAGAISSSVRLKHPDIGWERMRGFSSFAKHEYWRVNPELVWRAIEEMPSLKDKIGKVDVRPPR
jgi:uncharacterized protein with HEPN domain